jgi:hypothetical protein
MKSKKNLTIIKRINLQIEINFGMILIFKFGTISKTFSFLVVMVYEKEIFVIFVLLSKIMRNENWENNDFNCNSHFIFK